METSKEMVSRAMIAASRELRQNSTDAEYVLWEHLRDRRLGELKLRRQNPIRGTNYIADFYLHEARLVIELDGPIHDQQQEADRRRQEAIEAAGYRVIRFTNAQVFQDMARILDAILEAASDSWREWPSP